MPDNKKKNDVAAALAALAGGAVPSEGETPSGGIPSETTVFSPPPATPLPSQAMGNAPAPAPPSSRSVQRTPRPAAMPATELRGAPAPSLLPKDLPRPSALPPPARIRPAGPDGPPRPRPAMPERPAPAPVPLPPPDEPVLGSEAESIIADEDDDQTIAAAPDASAFAPRVHGSKPVHTAIYANLFFRRTIIPILLTCGVMLPAIGIWSMIDRNAPLAAIGTGVEVLLIVVGAVLLALGVLNAFHVKHIMETSAARGMS